jgi:transposase
LNGRTNDYSRHGTTSLFAALDIKTGHVLGECHQHYCSIEFRKFLDQVDAATPAIFEIHIIMGNYATYKTPLMHRWLSRHPRYHIHFTPTGAAWLNLVERWFAILPKSNSGVEFTAGPENWKMSFTDISKSPISNLNLLFGLKQPTKS